ncbi:2-dehydro-3-deoxyphosphogluconate aldolase/4-hydroxy-2-oxoglutarate aldolase [Halorubrum sp. AJ67]|nr:2-dehydro-3-deoxyphosphogluconate aldolase/4-hydroxy-2-oxoglutarate aldolase [Halorubrum sp. AJ67]
MRTDRFDRITDGGVIAILRGVARDDAVAVADAVVDAGVTALEVTADTPNATSSIEAISDRVDDALVGAGTVLDPETARAAQLAGAEFLVTPTVNADVIEAANRYGTPVVVGAYTPTEALEAYQAGADAVKVFPAKTGGPDHVGAIGGPPPPDPARPDRRRRRGERRGVRPGGRGRGRRREFDRRQRGDRRRRVRRDRVERAGGC